MITIRIKAWALQLIGKNIKIGNYQMMIGPRLMMLVTF